MSSDRQIPLKHKIEYIIVKATLKGFKYMPESFIYGFTNFIALLFFKLEKRHRIITIKNLEIAFPEKSSKDIAKLAEKSYASLSKTIAEIILIYNDRYDINSHIVNHKEVFAKLKDIQKSNGIVFATAHFSNWELLAQVFAVNDFKMLGIGRKGTNYLIEENITKPFRQKYGNVLAYKDLAILKIVKRLKKNQCVGILMDQKAGGAGVSTTFFGREVDTVSSVATLKLKYNPLIIPIFLARQKDGKYKIEMYDPIELPDKISLSDEEKISKIVQQYNDILEDVIKKYPEQWFWMHNRWRL